MKIPRISNLNRLFHTVRPLRWKQVFYRLNYRLRFWAKPKQIKETNIEPDLLSDFAALRALKIPLKTLFKPETILKGQFEFIHLEEHVGFPPNWDFRSPHKLWRYQLHYFEWLYCLDYIEARKCVLSWIENYHYDRNRDGWEAYPTSLRLMSWSAYFVATHRSELSNDPSFSSILSQSIETQTTWLERNLEYHLMANHLLENAAALCVTGSLFNGKSAGRWKETGSKILKQEIQEQVLPDGMHFERSPMYHLRMLNVLKETKASLKSNGGHYLKPVLRSMEKALDLVRHPDEDIALLNDSNLGVYPLPLSSDKSFSPMPGPWQLPDAGYYGYRGSEGEYIIFDAGPIGPDYNPGHSHGDMFSYEVTWNYHKMVVDTGNFDYEPGLMRFHCRSTKAHNTVQINEENQCAFWGTFRVGKRIQPEDVKYAEKENGFHLEATHSGYRRFPERAVHRRLVDFHAGNPLRIQDWIQAEKSVHAVSRIHFHPDCKCLDITARQLVIRNANVDCIIEWDRESSARLEDSFYCPEFNTKLPNKVLALTQIGTDLRVHYSLRFTKG